MTKRPDMREHAPFALRNLLLIPDSRWRRHKENESDKVERPTLQALPAVIVPVALGTSETPAWSLKSTTAAKRSLCEGSTYKCLQGRTK